MAKKKRTPRWVYIVWKQTKCRYIDIQPVENAHVLADFLKRLPRRSILLVNRGKAKAMKGMMSYAGHIVSAPSIRKIYIVRFLPNR